MLSERRKLIEDIGVARAVGARLAPACESAGICLRTYRRWTREDAVAADRRGQAVRLTPAHPLSEAERAELLRVCSEPRFASLPPSQIVPRRAVRRCVPGFGIELLSCPARGESAATPGLCRCAAPQAIDEP